MKDDLIERQAGEILGEICNILDTRLGDNPVLALKASDVIAASRPILTALKAKYDEIAKLREELAKSRVLLVDSMTLEVCQCDDPIIRCDHRGCRCTMCGKPERRARTALGGSNG